jgi:hypothetical protein
VDGVGVGVGFVVLVMSDEGVGHAGFYERGRPRMIWRFGDVVI